MTFVYNYTCVFYRRNKMKFKLRFYSLDILIRPLIDIKRRLNFPCTFLCACPYIERQNKGENALNTVMILVILFIACSSINMAEGLRRRV